ncbi:sensor histidine kinase [Fundidesulfovibrio terrae]|uniref:sensor histidine kinase n=1 Tax=Fundidesulfovibrio terrae TaxID=2922866 RepID=UPI001FAF9518|nr:response regulator [Fundidesulfovibrio terrae]
MSLLPGSMVKLDSDGCPAHPMRILCVDDEPALRLTVQAFLQDMGHSVATAQDGMQGLELIQAETFDAVLLDLAMPGMSGLAVLERAAALKPNLPVVVVSGTGNIHDVIAALRLGAWDFLTKPIEDMAILVYSLEKVIERASLIRENQLHRERLEVLVRKRTQKLRKEIAERRSVEKALRISLAEKEVLLKEVHHRVKNNLQIVSSLLSLQSLKYDESLAAAFLDSQARVRAMALVHEKLYRSGDLSRIDFPDYLRQLSTFLLQAYRPKDKSVTSDIECRDLCLPVDFAIPCGLIVNELFTNSLKHAFTGRTSGVIRLRASQEGSEARLVVEDNGVGFPPDISVDAADSLGLQLVTNLTHQLRGTMDVVSDASGSRFTLRFPIPAPRSVLSTTRETP